MTKRPRHPIKEIEEAVAYAEGKGWRWRQQGHWGRLYCAHADREGYQFGVQSTPRSAEAHARQIMRAVDRCPHQKDDGDGNL